MNAFHGIVQLWGSRITKINYQCPREILCSNWLPIMELRIPLRAASSSPRYLGALGASCFEILGAPTARLCHSRGLPLLHDMIIHNVSCIKSLGSEAIRKGEMIQRGWFIPQSKGNICWSRILRKRFSEIIQRRISFVPQQFNIAEKDGQFQSSFHLLTIFFVIGDGFVHQKKLQKFTQDLRKSIFVLFPKGFPIGFPMVFHIEHVGCRRRLSWRQPHRIQRRFPQRRPRPRHQRIAQRPVAMAPDKSFLTEWS